MGRTLVLRGECGILALTLPGHHLVPGHQSPVRLRVIVASCSVDKMRTVATSCYVTPPSSGVFFSN